MEYQLSVAKSVNTVKPLFQGHQESTLSSDLVVTMKKRGRVDSQGPGYWTISNQNTTVHYFASTITTMLRSQQKDTHSINSGTFTTLITYYRKP
jgi:N-methylhydantoinase B/oxoprolinase/acetone carboxylase alpha subunit